jgi:hypothetical protein
VPLDYAMSDDVETHRTTHGVPFSWHETKSIQFLLRLLGDLPEITHVYDLGAGSAAVAIASWRCGLIYDGVCNNQAHKTWLENIMDTCMHAVVADGIRNKDTTKERGFQDKLMQFFGPQVDEGRRLIHGRTKLDVVEPRKDPNEEDPQPEEDEEEQ